MNDKDVPIVITYQLRYLFYLTHKLYYIQAVHSIYKVNETAIINKHIVALGISLSHVWFWYVIAHFTGEIRV